MRKTLLLCVFACMFQIVKAQNEFITIWKPGTSNQIHFPGRGTNFNVSWEEVGYSQHSGMMNNITSDIEFTLDFGTPFNPVPANATYKVKVSNGSGNFYQIRFFDNTTSPIYFNLEGSKLLEVSQWGNIIWQSFSNAFVYCINMDVTASDAPNLSNVTEMNEMFYICPSLTNNASFNTWNTSTVTNMYYMFGECALFNAPINNWNVSNVTNMSYMFDAANNFNQPIAEWNVANVTTMQHMFHEANAFNQDLRNWNVANVVNMNEIFHDAGNFNQNLGNWNLSSLTNGVDMLLNSGLSCQNYSNTLIGWSANTATPSNITLSSASPLVYSNLAAASARLNLINNKGWIIFGDTYNAQCYLSVSDTKNDDSQMIYPNPASDFIYIKNVKDIGRFVIFDASGRTILKGSLKEKIDVRNLVKGNYIVQIITKDAVKSLKFIKK